MSMQLVVQLKAERDKYSLQAFNLKRILESISNNDNMENKEGFKSLAEVLAFAHKKLTELEK